MRCLLCLFLDFAYIEGLTSILKASLLSNQRSIGAYLLELEYGDSPSGIPLSAEHVAQALLKNLQKINTKVTQLILYLSQEWAPQLAAQLVLLRSLGNPLE